MFTGNARKQFIPRLLKNIDGPSWRTVSETQWRNPLYLFCSPTPSIWRRALITSMGVPTDQPAIPATPPENITTVQSVRVIRKKSSEYEIFTLLQTFIIRLKAVEPQKTSAALHSNHVMFCTFLNVIMWRTQSSSFRPTWLLLSRFAEFRTQRVIRQKVCGEGRSVPAGERKSSFIKSHNSLFSDDRQQTVNGSTIFGFGTVESVPLSFGLTLKTNFHNVTRRHYRNLKENIYVSSCEVEYHFKSVFHNDCVDRCVKRISDLRHATSKTWQENLQFGVAAVRGVNVTETLQTVAIGAEHQRRRHGYGGDR